MDKEKLEFTAPTILTYGFDHKDNVTTSTASWEIGSIDLVPDLNK